MLGVIVGGALAAAWSVITAAVLPLATVTALMVGGTGAPLMPPTNDELFVQNFLGHFGNTYVDPAADRWGLFDSPQTNTGDRRVAVYTPEQFWPLPGSTMTFDRSVMIGVQNVAKCVSGPAGCPANPEFFHEFDQDDALVVFGYSQSGRVLTDVKRAMIDWYSQQGWDTAPDVSFVIIGNPNRPNGGILERLNGLSIPFVGITFDGATPTDSCVEGVCHFRTEDISTQYDGFSDFPLYPLNLIATLNAVAGMATVHGGYQPAVTEAMKQGVYGDTTYYMIPTERLPMLSIVENVIPDPVRGWLGPLFTLLDSPLRAITEMGYDRGLSPGSPESMKLIRFQPITDVLTFGNALLVGIDNALAEIAGDPGFRPLGTKKSTSPYGVDTVRISDLFGSNAVTDFIDKAEDTVNRFRLFGGNSGQPNVVQQNVDVVEDGAVEPVVESQNLRTLAVESGARFERKQSMGEKPRSQWPGVAARSENPVGVGEVPEAGLTPPADDSGPVGLKIRKLFTRNKTVDTDSEAPAMSPRQRWRERKAAVAAEADQDGPVTAKLDPRRGGEGPSLAGKRDRVGSPFTGRHGAKDPDGGAGPSAPGDQHDDASPSADRTGADAV
ncbi:hypothetical protein MBRU_10265 [Mycolicibacterium brumae DSM 44177]|nr:hypothetical protein MBRU_10265 [Mycolicibacterium brumae DSM 44177]